MQEMWVQSLSQEDPWRTRRRWQPTQYYCLRNPMSKELGGLQSVGGKGLDTTEYTCNCYLVQFKKRLLRIYHIIYSVLIFWIKDEPRCYTQGVYSLLEKVSQEGFLLRMWFTEEMP